MEFGIRINHFANAIVFEACTLKRKLITMIRSLPDALP